MMKDESTMKQNESLQSISDTTTTVGTTTRTTRTLHLLAVRPQISESTGITVAEGHSAGKRVCVHKKGRQRSQRRNITGD